MTATLQAALNQLIDRLEEIKSLGVSLLWQAVAGLPLAGDVAADGALLETLFAGSSDFVTRPVMLAGGRGMLLWLSTMTESKIVDKRIYAALARRHEPREQVADRVTAATFGEAAHHILAGRVLLLAPGQASPTAFDARGYQHRPVSEPVLESVVRGPHEAFNEDLATSVALVRRRLADPRLRVESLTVGALSHTEVRLLYVQGLTSDALVNEARRRLRDISSTHVLDTNYLEEAMEDDPYSIFPQVIFTERPDVTVAALTEGRFAVLGAGTSNALVAPVSFWSFLQAADDYYQRYWVASFLRLLRVLLLFLALLLPSLYVAVTTFHQQMLPTPLLLAVAHARANIPFPAIVEAFVMEISLEILREAALHLPGKLGTSLSVVGALIIGQAAVSAGLVSWPMVVIVSVTALANFALPRWSMALTVRLLRFSLMLVAAVLGLPGVVLGVAVIIAHLCTLRSFGLPYLFPLAPFSPEGIGDVLARLPHWVPARRPRLLSPHWGRRVRPGHRPGPAGMTGTA